MKKKAMGRNKNHQRACSSGSDSKNMVDIEHMTGAKVAALWGISEAAVSQWDCPRNEDGTYDLVAVIKWREAKLTEKPNGKVDLEKEKLALQNEKLEIEIRKMKDESISLDTHKQILCSRAEGLRIYLTDVFDKNLHHFANKPIEVLRPLKESFVREVLNNYVKNHK